MNFALVWLARITELLRRHPRARLLLCCGMIVGATCCAFAPSLANGFVPWDDDVYVYNNPDIKAFTLKNLVKIFSSTYVANFQPLTLLSYMADHQFFALNPKAYHATNLLLHVANALLVFALALQLSRCHLTSLVVALLFALHPLRVESVAWIAERKDVLSAFFYLLSLCLYVRHLRDHRRAAYWLSLVALLLSLLSKPMAVTLPLVLLALDYFHQRQWDRKALLDKIPFALLAALFAVATLLTQQSGGVQTSVEISRLQRLCTPFYGFIFYLAKTVVPADLCSLYPLPPEISGVTAVLLYTSPLLATGAAALIYRLRARVPALAFGFLFYLFALLPVLQIVPIGNALVAERYSYLPLLGPTLAVALLCQSLFDRKLVLAGLGAAVVLLGIATHQRCAVWKDGLTLWNDAIATYPSAVAYNNRGVFFISQGQFDRAIEDLDQAVSRSSVYFEALDNRGFAHLSRHEFDLAIEDHTEALRLNPNDAVAYNDRAIAYNNKREHVRAIEDLDNAIRLKPTAAAYANRGVARSAVADYARAINDFDESIRIEPEYRAAYYGRALAFRAVGDQERALRDFKRACALGHQFACRSLQRYAN